MVAKERSGHRAWLAGYLDLALLSVRHIIASLGTEQVSVLCR
jgi:hypothetical protein